MPLFAVVSDYRQAIVRSSDINYYYVRTTTIDFFNAGEKKKKRKGKPNKNKKRKQLTVSTDKKNRIKKREEGPTVFEEAERRLRKDVGTSKFFPLRFFLFLSRALRTIKRFFAVW